MQTQADFEEVEQIARQLGYDWGIRVREEYTIQDRSPDSWPGTLQQARELVDGIIGDQTADEERETLAMLVERGARRAWRAPR